MDARIVRCKSCGRSVEVPHPESQGHPHGWLFLTVGVPDWFNAGSGKHYRWVGMYCSADCLGAGLASIREEEALMKYAYPHD